ncbi:MAG: hypothetical protein ACREL6_03620 [Gemmatimonadales bacterium]
MRGLLTFLLLILLAAPTYAQDTTAITVAPAPTPPPADPADVASIDAIIDAAYESISGPAGPRQWERFRSLFGVGARLIPTGCREQTGECGAQVFTPEQYIQRASVYFDENPFYEISVNNVVERYGLIAHVFSTYESRNSPDDAEPFVSGINSFQLFWNGERWWIMSIMWADVNGAGEIPAKYM